MKHKRDLLKRAGQLFIVGFDGATPTPAFIDFIREERIGGVILFEENCVTHSATAENITAIKSACSDLSPFVAIDQEGGRVCRLRGAPVEFPAASVLGAASDTFIFRETYKRALLYMESLGINLNLAPVADINLGDNSYMKERCFGSDGDTVARFVSAAVEVSDSAGMLCCLKHFPGLGEAKIDPHEQTAIAEYDRIVWEQREKIPFEQGVRSGADMIMTTHLKVPRLDDKIVTGSRKVINELVRGDLQFDGPLITDDLTMKGADCLGNYGERAVAAFNAGHDILLFGRNFEAAMEAFDYFVESCRRGDILADRLQASIDRVAGLKFKLSKSIAHWNAT